MKVRALALLLLASSGYAAGCATDPAPESRTSRGAGRGSAMQARPPTADVVEAVQRGEARDVLAAREREAAESDRRGLGLEAAKAYGAVTAVAPRVGELQKGIRAGLRALELLKREPQTPEVVGIQVAVHNALGHTYRLAGDVAAARRFFEGGLELVGTLPEQRRNVIVSANLSRGLASVEQSEGDYANALLHGSEAVRSLEGLLAQLPHRADRPRQNAHHKLALALMQVGNVQRRLGNLDEADAALHRALVTARGGRLLEVQAQVAYSLGHVALSRKDYAQASSRFQEALSLATRLDRVPLLIHAHAGLGSTALLQGRPDEALGSFAHSLELVESVRGQLEEAGLRSGFVEDKQGIYRGAVQSALAVGRPEEAFGYAERGRARAFLDLLGNQTLSRGRSRALMEEEARLRARLHEARAMAEDALEEGDPPQARERAEAAAKAYRDFLDRVRKESLEQASLMTVEPVTLQEIQRLLPEDTTLVEYLVSERESIAWVIGRGRVEVVRLPVPRRDLLSQVREFRKAISGQAPMEQLEERARALHERLLAPARPHIRGDRLLIVPHDVLHYLPFGALRSSEGRWLVEDFTLATLPSASVLKYLPGKGTDAPDRALALGNPDLGPALALRWAEREARAVGERLPGATVLLRQDATETRAKTLAAQMGLLHFATHAELNEADPLASALLLVPEGGEDGRLEVRELFGLDLHARLVVLSACDTGLGKLSRGDELVGLQRAFLYAGTPAVVTTLWKVDDRASFLLMRAFYDELSRGQSPAAALRRAQRAAMREFPHPFAWAAFGLTGAPR